MRLHFWRTSGFIGLLSLVSVALMACTTAAPPAATSAPAAPAKEQPKEQPKESIRIGVTMPLTGALAEYGANINTAVLMAAEEINAAGGINGRKLEVLSEDTQGDPKNAVAATRKLISVDKAVAIMTSFTGQTLAQIPVADELQAVIFANSTLPTTASMSPWAFNTFVSSPYQTQVVTEFAIKQLGYKRFSVMMCGTEQCRASQTALEETTKKNGADIAATEIFDTNGTDFRTALTKLQGVKVDAMLLFGTGGKAEGLVLKQMAEMGFKVQVLGQGPSMEGPDTIPIAGEAANGVIYASSELDLAAPKTAAFVEAFKKRAGKAPDFGQVTFYDTTNLLGQVMAKNGAEPKAIREGLLASGSYKGVAGELQIAKDRTAQWNTIIKTIKGGKYVRY
ncbi:MAG: ABC transporter substrate-binding protein [Chloroflexi bacterium]|nr:ABC transporter substrate-binding protein [Chloroflexota bacterium]